MGQFFTSFQTSENKEYHDEGAEISEAHVCKRKCRIKRVRRTELEILLGQNKPCKWRKTVILPSQLPVPKPFAKPRIHKPWDFVKKVKADHGRINRTNKAVFRHKIVAFTTHQIPLCTLLHLYCDEPHTMESLPQPQTGKLKDYQVVTDTLCRVKNAVSSAHNNQELHKRIKNVPLPGRHLPQLHETKKLGMELEHRLRFMAAKLDIKLQNNNKYMVNLVMAR